MQYRVTITDVLDESLDLSKVKFLGVHFGDEKFALDKTGGKGLTTGHTISPAGNRTRANLTQPVSIPYPNVLKPSALDFTIDMERDTNTRTLTWILSSTERLAASTLVDTTDPQAGFLPPNENKSGIGAGSVSFSTRVLGNAPGGTEVPNTATIQFDIAGPMISTKPIVNQIEPCGAIPFRRGDTNGLGEEVDISDAITVLGFLFNGTAELGCKRAADVQNDGSIDLSDAIFILQFLFNGGEPIPPPNACDDAAAFEPSPLHCCEYPSCR